MDEFFYREDGRVIGPISADNLKELCRRGRIKPQTEIRKDKGFWVRAGRIKNLARLLTAENPVVVFTPSPSLPQHLAQEQLANESHLSGLIPRTEEVPKHAQSNASANPEQNNCNDGAVGKGREWKGKGREWINTAKDIARRKYSGWWIVAAAMVIFLPTCMLSPNESDEPVERPVERRWTPSDLKGEAGLLRRHLPKPIASKTTASVGVFASAESLMRVRNAAKNGDVVDTAKAMAEETKRSNIVYLKENERFRIVDKLKDATGFEFFEIESVGGESFGVRGFILPANIMADL